MPSEGDYENGYAWGGEGVAPPYYGAFAQRFATDGTGGCGVAFDFSTLAPAERPMDIYVWADHGGVPGEILTIVPRVDPGPIAVWPQISRHSFELPVPIQGDVWIGYWGAWPGEEPAWFVAADTDGRLALSSTNVAPGLGVPTGWQELDPIFGPTQSIGIGVNNLNDPSAVGPAPVSAGLAPEIFVSRTVMTAGESIRLSLSIPEAGHALLGIYDLSGREVARLVDGELAAGTQSVVWEAARGSAIGSGVYWARLTTAGSNVSQRLIVVH